VSEPHAQGPAAIPSSARSGDRRNPFQALKLLEAAGPYDLAFPQPQFKGGGLLYPAYVRSQAFMLLHQGKEGANEFQKFLDHRGVVINSVLAALARYQLARALSLSGDFSAARKAFQDFFALWKDADPDIPILKQAKAETGADPHRARCRGCSSAWSHRSACG
jgi:eukaryotic-like serine/threonine-protein kinase